MSFVYDAEPLFDGKQWYSSPVAPRNKSLWPDDWNGTQAYLDDIRNALISAEYFGLAQSTEGVAAANKAKIRLNTSNELQVSINGAAYVSLGVLTLATFGSTPAAEGASIASQVLTLQPASATYPGGVSIGSQAFSGDKRFAGNVSIGTITPGFPFDIFKSNAGLAVGRVINSAADGLSAFRFLDSGGSDGLIVGVGNGGAPAPYTSLNFIAATQGTISFLSNGAVNATLTQAGVFAPVGGLNLPTGAPLYSNGSAGTAGHLLTSGGAGAAPTWAANPNSGTNTGDVTLGAFGSTPNANAASLTGQALTLQPASASYPGGVSTGAQSFAGVKSFVNAAVFNSTNLEGIAAQILGLGSGRVHYSTRTSDGNYGRLVVRGRSNAGVAIGATGASASSVQYVGTLSFYVQTIAELDTATPTGSGTEVLSIGSDGKAIFSTTKLVVDVPNSRVGINVAAPARAFDVRGAGAATPMQIVATDTNGFSGVVYCDTAGTAKASTGYANSATASPYTSNYYFNASSSVDTIWLTNGTERIKMSSAGVLSFTGTNFTVSTAGLVTPAAGIDLDASGAVLKTGGSAGTTNQALLSTGASTRPAWTTIPLESNSSAAVFQYGAQTLATGTGVEVVFPGYNAAAGSNTDPNLIGWIVPYTGKVSNLYVKAYGAPAGANVEFTLYRTTTAGSVATTTITCTMNAGSTSASDTSHSFNVTAGEEIFLRATPSGTITTAATGVRANCRVTLA